MKRDADHRPTLPRRRETLARLAALPVATALAAPWGGRAMAAEGGLTHAEHGDTSAEWDKLRPAIFGARPLQAGQDVVRLTAPLRAAYGASVPIKITAAFPQQPERWVRKLWVVIDKNPSPLAAEIELGLDCGQADFETRLRVDEYSHVRVVAELSDGSLHTDSRFVKTSGGCSAPPNRDSPELIGKTLLHGPATLVLGQPNTADVTVIHPNDTGFELNQVTVMTIPAHFVRSIKVRYDGRKIFDAEMDFSISENPTLRFKFVPHGPGELRADVMDSHDARFSGAIQLG